MWANCASRSRLRAAARVAAAFQGLLVALQAEPLALEQHAHHRVADLVALRLQRGRQVAQAQAGPAQGRHRAAPLGGRHQSQQGAQQPRVTLHQRLAPAAFPAHPAALQRFALVQLAQAASNGAGRDPRRTRHRGNPAMARRTRLTGRKQPATPLVQVRRQQRKARTDRGRVNHPTKLWHHATHGNPGYQTNSVGFLQALSSTLAFSGWVACGFGEAVEECARDCHHVPVRR